MLAMASGQEGIDDGLDALTDIDRDTALIGFERFQRVELRLQQCGRHEVVQPAGLTTAD